MYPLLQRISPCVPSPKQCLPDRWGEAEEEKVWPLVRQSTEAQTPPRHLTRSGVSWDLQPLGFSYLLPQIHAISQVYKEDMYAYSLYLLAKTSMKESTTEKREKTPEGICPIREIKQGAER